MQKYRLAFSSKDYGLQSTFIGAICNIARGKHNDGNHFCDCTVVKFDINENNNNNEDYSYNNFAEDLSSAPCPYVFFIIYKKDSVKNPLHIEYEDINYIGISDKANFYPQASAHDSIFYEITSDKYIPLPACILLDKGENLTQFSVLCLLFDGKCDVTLIPRIKNFMMNNQTCDFDNFFGEMGLAPFYYYSEIEPNSLQIVEHTVCKMRYIEIERKGKMQ